MALSFDSPGTRTRVAATLATLVVAALVARSVAEATTSAIGWSMFTDRDLVRGEHFLTAPTHAGAELASGVGGRVPGALLGVLFGLPLWLGGDVRTVFVFQLLLEGLAVVVLCAGLARRDGGAVGLAAGLTLLGSTTEAEVVQGLWNPGFLPLFSVGALLCADVAVRDRRPWGLVGVALCTALGAQLHLSMLLVGVPLGVGVLLAGPRPTAGTLVRVALAVVVAYLPYLVGEALCGWANTRDLLEQQVVARGVDAFAAPFASLPGWGLELLGDPVEPTSRWLGPSARGAVSVGALTLGVLVVGAHLHAARVSLRPADDADRRAGRSALVDVATLGAGLLYLSTDTTLGPQARYVVVFVPLVARLVANGVRTAGALPGAVGGVAAAVALVAVLAVAPPARTRFLSADTHDPHTLQGVVRRLDEVRQATGWDLRDVVSRTVWLHRSPDGPRIEDGPSLDFLLDRAGTPLDGSGAPPCVLLLDQHGAGPRLDVDATLATLVPEGVTDRRVLRDEEDRATVLYTPRVGRCPTSMTQRYLPTPVEATLHAQVETLPCDVAVVLSPSLFAVRYDFGPPGTCGGRAALAVGLERSGDLVRATLHGNQLRGLAPNDGWYRATVLRTPTLVFTNTAGAQVELPLAAGRVGALGEATPLHASVALGAGPWSVRLTAEKIAQMPPFPLPDPLPDAGRIDVVLTPAWAP